MVGVEAGRIDLRWEMASGGNLEFACRYQRKMGEKRGSIMITSQVHLKNDRPTDRSNGQNITPRTHIYAYIKETSEVKHYT